MSCKGTLLHIILRFLITANQLHNWFDFKQFLEFVKKMFATSVLTCNAMMINALATFDYYAVIFLYV